MVTQVTAAIEARLPGWEINTLNEPNHVQRRQPDGNATCCGLFMIEDMMAALLVGCEPQYDQYPATQRTAIALREHNVTLALNSPYSADTAVKSFIRRNTQRYTYMLRVLAASTKPSVQTPPTAFQDPSQAIALLDEQAANPLEALAYQVLLEAKIDPALRASIIQHIFLGENDRLLALLEGRKDQVFEDATKRQSITTEILPCLRDRIAKGGGVVRTIVGIDAAEVNILGEAVTRRCKSESGIITTSLLALEKYKPIADVATKIFTKIRRGMHGGTKKSEEKTVRKGSDLRDDQVLFAHVESETSFNWLLEYLNVEALWAMYKALALDYMQRYPEYAVAYINRLLYYKEPKLSDAQLKLLVHVIESLQIPVRNQHQILIDRIRTNQVPTEATERQTFCQNIKAAFQQDFNTRYDSFATKHPEGGEYVTRFKSEGFLHERPEEAESKRHEALYAEELDGAESDDSVDTPQVYVDMGRSRKETRNRSALEEKVVQQMNAFLSKNVKRGFWQWFKDFFTFHDSRSPSFFMQAMMFLAASEIAYKEHSDELLALLLILNERFKFHARGVVKERSSTVFYPLMNPDIHNFLMQFIDLRGSDHVRSTAREVVGFINLERITGRYVGGLSYGESDRPRGVTVPDAGDKAAESKKLKAERDEALRRQHEIERENAEIARELAALRASMKGEDPEVLTHSYASYSSGNDTEEEGQKAHLIPKRRKLGIN